MTHMEHEETVLHMGPPVNNGKLAMWIFLATEIMFFTALIGTYIILRNGTPKAGEWPTPERVHLKEWIGALNTFVLICSSVTVVLAHYALVKGNVGKAVQFIAATLALGGVFLVIKAYEYNSKFHHRILPGHVFDRLEGNRGVEYLARLRSDLEDIIKGGSAGPAAADCRRLLDAVTLRPDGRSGITPEDAAKHVDQILEKNHDLHLQPKITFGNLWASCYFAMTGFHALHVLGGLVIFVIILIKASLGSFGVQHAMMLELTGLYWHFVDIVWIFLFPLLYLV